MPVTGTQKAQLPAIAAVGRAATMRAAAIPVPEAPETVGFSYTKLEPSATLYTRIR